MHGRAARATVRRRAIGGGSERAPPSAEDQDRAQTASRATKADVLLQSSQVRAVLGQGKTSQRENTVLSVVWNVHMRVNLLFNFIFFVFSKKREIRV